MDKIAVIDCGTNTFHLLIAAQHQSKLDVLHKEKVSVRVGQGGINENILLPDAIKRATDTISHFADIIKKEGVNRTYAFATSAFRNALNGEAARAQILNETGIDLKIISGKEEAELIFRGVNSGLKIGQEPALVMDIGGGSVEFIIGNDDEVLWMQSFEIGAQRMLDLFHKTDPIRKKEIQQLENYLKVNLAELLDQLTIHKPVALIGSSGTFDTLSEIYCRKKGINPGTADTEVPLPMEEYQKIHAELIRKTREERMAIPGMIEMRVDMIVVASSLIHFLLKTHKFQELRVSTSALKEGVLDRILTGQL